MAISSRAQREMDAATLADYYRSFAAAGARRFNKSCFAVLNNNTSASYLKGDGVAWASTSHPSNVGVQSNLGSSALDNAAFEAAVKALREMLGPDGQLTPHDAALLYVPPALDGTAYQILGSEFSAADDRRAINISRTRGVEYSASPYLSAAYGGSDTMWHLFSAQALQAGIARVNVFDAPSPRLEKIEG
ncbi:phage major capsid protein, partial [Salipiger bermudensis]|uniref:phage major capsid protein n=1 Tax=Salipiger bermudensis TaxID=344736 RepID=UPI00351740DC